MAVFAKPSSRLQALRQVSIFSNLAERDLERIDRHVTGTTLAPGTVVAREGRVPQQLVLLLGGSASVERGGQVIATLSAGDTIGELSLLDGGQQTATVTTDEESEALVVPAQEFRDMLDGSPALTRNLLIAMAQRLRGADELLTA